MMDALLPRLHDTEQAKVKGNLHTYLSWQIS